MAAKLRHHIHLVGSIPLNDAAEVFETVSAALGPAIDRLPDGETGARLSWLGWLQPVFTEHPDFRQTEETRRKNAEGRPTYRFRLRPGTSGETVSFDALPQATVAIASYNVFARLKADGKIPGHVKFQVSIANPISVVDRFIVAGDRDAVQPRFVEALLDQVAEICASIPHDELALQWDVASAIFAPLEMNEPGRFGATKQEAYTTFAQILGRIGEVVPSRVDLLYHLCYGDFGHRHTVEPTDMGDMVEIANRITKAVPRSIQLFHMPVPISRNDDAYFQPLMNLSLRPESRLSLGLVHQSDGVEGAQRRIATAKRYVPEFLIATECGFGRRPAGTIPDLLRLHAELAGLRTGSLTSCT